jgi:hypothetical protein
MKFIIASLSSLLLFVGPAQAQDFCLDLCTDCTIFSSDALAALNAAVGLNPQNCTGTTTTTLSGPTTTTTTLPNTSEVCQEALCAVDSQLEQRCDSFLTECLALADDTSEDECLAASLWLCNGGICGRQECAASDAKMQECRDAFDPCMEAAENRYDIEQCVAVAVLQCGLF